MTWRPERPLVFRLKIAAMALLTMATMIPSMKMARNRIQKPALAPETATGAAVAMDYLRKRTVDEFGGSIARCKPGRPNSKIEPAVRPPLELAGYAAPRAVCFREPAGPVDPAADWQYPADPDSSARKGVPAHHLLREGRMVQSGRCGQGPAGAAHDRGGRTDWRVDGGEGHPGLDVGEHRHRLRPDRRRQGVPGEAGDAGECQRGTPRDRPRLRRGSDFHPGPRGLGWRHPRGAPDQGVGTRGVFHAGPVQQPIQLARAFRYHRS